jgi:hypothetical protein
MDTDQISNDMSVEEIDEPLVDTGDYEINT